jgi:myosin heavy subunit
VSDKGDKIKGTIAAEEECNEPKLKGTFEMNKKDGDLDLVMDYSDMADKGIKDMIDIDELNHATILYNLYKRYIRGDINTYVGPTLLVINPFGKVPITPMESYREITDAENFYDV